MYKKLYLGNNSSESNIEENIDLEDQFRIKNLPHPVENSDAVCKSYDDSGLNHPSILRNLAHLDFIDKYFVNVRFGKVNILPAVCQHLTAKYKFDQAISKSVDETTLV